MSFKSLSKVSLATWVRVIFLLVTLGNQVGKSLGFTLIPIEEAHLEEFISNALLILAALGAMWKNNSFTEEAQEAQEYLKNRKAEKQLANSGAAPSINADTIEVTTGYIDEVHVEEASDETVG